MSIGTAAPTKEELEAAKHHFIHHKSITEAYNVGAFEKEAIQQIKTLHQSHDIVIMVGGSGLYVDAVTRGLDKFPEVDKAIRKQLNNQLEQEGLQTLQRQLKQLDPVSFDAIAIDNPHRVIRALEICIGSGQPYSSFLNKDKNKRPFKTITIGLEAERPIIYDRINQRVHKMIEAGLVEEVKTLLPFKHLNSLNTVGYKEVFNYLEGEWTLDVAISEIQKNSRRFAKRQLTWFRKNPETHWYDYTTALKDVIILIESQLQ